MYKYYQPNNKDIDDSYGDCAIRALSKILSLSWIDTFNFLHDYELKYQCPIAVMSHKLELQFYKEINMIYHGIKHTKGTVRPTVAEFTDDHPQGRYLLVCAGHHVASVDGTYYDTWDSGDKKLYGYYELIEGDDNNE